jgi:hypothetical protein
VHISCFNTSLQWCWRILLYMTSGFVCPSHVSCTPWHAYTCFHWHTNESIISWNFQNDFSLMRIDFQNLILLCWFHERVILCQERAWSSCNTDTSDISKCSLNWYRYNKYRNVVTGFEWECWDSTFYLIQREEDHLHSPIECSVQQHWIENRSRKLETCIIHIITYQWSAIIVKIHHRAKSIERYPRSTETGVLSNYSNKSQSHQNSKM